MASDAASALNTAGENKIALDVHSNIRYSFSVHPTRSKTDARKSVTFYRGLRPPSRASHLIRWTRTINRRAAAGLRVRRAEPYRPDRPGRGRRVAVVVRLLERLRACARRHHAVRG